MDVIKSLNQSDAKAPFKQVYLHKKPCLFLSNKTFYVLDGFCGSEESEAET